MKHALLLVIVFFLALFAYTSLAGPIPFTITSTTTQKTDTFTVSGEGKIVVVPDMAVVSVGVQSQGKTVKETQSDTNTRINAVTESIKALGVDNKDIQTSNYSMYPTYDYSNGTQRITGYQTNSTLEIKIRTIDKTNEVIDSATKAGANSVGGINFAVSDKTKALSQARGLAVSQAKQKASEAANTVGFRLGKIINYTESEANSRSPIPFSAMAKADSADSTQVEAGSAEIVLTVTLSYELE